MASIDDLEGKSKEALDKLTGEEQKRLDDLLATKDPDFGLGGRSELLPVSDAEVQKAIDDLENALKMRNIVFIRAKQREALEEIERRKTSALAEKDRILLHGLREKVQPRERDSVRTASQPSRSRRQMFLVDQPCAKCGTNVHELPFEPDPGKAIYCPSCYQDVLASQGRGGGRRTAVSESSNPALQEKDDEITRLKEQLANASKSGGRGKLSKKERREQERLDREARGDT